MIQKNNIKIFASERLDDSSDSGGRITGNVIVSGEENNIFDDISRLDRTYGRISLRKVFVGVDSEDTDKYYGSHFIVSETPKDPAVSVTAFTTKNWDDQRAQAKDYIERYLAKGQKWLGYLFEKQLVGQKAIILWQRVSTELPNIGSVWCLVQNEGLVTQYEQYVRITRLSEKLQTFIDDKGEYIVRVVTIEISDPLIYEFEGIVPRRTDEGITTKASIRTTIPVDAARYYGTKKLTQSGSIGEMNVTVNSLFQQLVPSAQSEIPAVDLNAAGQLATVIPSGKGTVSFTTAATISANAGLYLGNACKPGTLNITVSGGTLTDDGSDIKFNGTTVVGSIQYAQGILLFNTACPTYSGTKTVTFYPAAPLNKVAETASIDILPENRGYVYTITLHPLPSPGMLFIDYMSQGKWYRLYDKGNGSIQGADTSFGSAQVNYITGSIILTCGALPDNNSSIIFFWATPVSTFNRSSITPPVPKIEFTLQHNQVAPSSFSCSWPTNKTVTDNGFGLLSGTGGTGTINYSTGKVSIIPTVLPLGGTTFTSNYSYGNPLLKEFAHPSRDLNGRIPLQTDLPNVVPKSVELEYNVLIDDYNAYTYTSSTFAWLPSQGSNWVDPIVSIRDNGLGAFVRDGTTLATIDYTTGSISLLPELVVQIPKPIYVNKPLGSTIFINRNQTPAYQITTTTYRHLFDKWEYIPAPAKFPIDETGWVKVRYRATDSPQSVVGETYTMSAVQFDITKNYLEQIIVGSARFTLAGRVYFDREGSLYHTLNALTGAATLGGTINYSTGQVSVTDWPTNISNTLTLESLLTHIQAQMTDRVVFRTPGAPIRPGSLYIQANKLDGTLISTTADMDGRIVDSDMSGTVDYQTGIVTIGFGQWTNPTGYESEPWYNSEAIRPDGKIFKPVPVDPTTIKYNTVVYTYLPLDSSILGLDPVRLPFDGKVPIYKKGDIAVIHSTKSVTCPNPLSAGYRQESGTVRLSRVEVRDIANKVVDPILFTEDLINGHITFVNPLSLQGYQQPLKLYYTVEDMAVVTDTEISGRLSINRPLSHNFSNTDSYVSSAIIMGDLYARFTNPFSQSTWTSVWSDSIIGTPILSQYNYNTNPIVVTNKGTIQQRWAIIFTSSSAFRVVGETLGQIGTGTVNELCAPINPNNNESYFELKAAGWGSGWSAGNLIRFNTYAANYPVYLCRTVLQSSASVETDAFRCLIRGDVDQ